MATSPVALYARAMARRYGSAVERRPYCANVFHGGALAFFGDALCQVYVEGVGERGFSWPRAQAVTAFGMVYQGAICTRLYQLMPTLLPLRLTTTRIRTGVGCTVLDNFVHVPLLYMPAYYATVGLIQGDNAAKIKQVMQECYKDAVVTCWGLWLPLQAITFSIVPHHLRVLFVSAGCLVWNAWLDWFSHRGNGTHGKETLSIAGADAAAV